MTLTERLGDWIGELGPWGLPVLFAAALLEYVFPPFPGDTVTLFGAWLSVRGVVPAMVVWTVVTAGSGAGMTVDWLVGRWLGRRMGRLPAEARRPWWWPLSQERVLKFEQGYRRWGAWLILANRFVPAVRAFFFLAAGASGIPLRQTLLLGLVSAGVWNVLVLAAGHLLVESLAELEALADTYSRWAWLVAVGIAALILAVAVLRWARRRRRSR